MKKTLLLLGLLTGLMCLAESEDLGQLVSQYAEKDGNIVWQVDRYGNRADYEYNSSGQMIGITRGTAQITNEYDSNGNMVKTLTSDGAENSFHYDALGRRVSAITPAGKANFEYDPYNRLISRSGAGSYPLKLNYTSWNELAGYTTGNGAETKFNYDATGKLTERVWPNGNKIEYGYDQFGRMAKKLESGKETKYTYNEFGRIVKEEITLGEQKYIQEFTYTADGHIASVSDDSGMITFTYDRFGRKLTEEGPIGKISNLYDGKGRLTAREVKFHDQSEAFLTEYSYDDFDRVVKVTSPSGEFKYTYDNEGRIATQSVGDKMVINEYDPSGRLVSKTFGDTVLAKYEYDAMDRRVAGQYFDVKWDYNYDQYNQLTSAKNSNGNSYQYTYDSIGNRLKAVENGSERSFSYNKLNQISNNEYAYDAWGNMTKTPEATYAYDLKNRLIKVTKSDGTVIEYIYDAMDQRINSKIADKGTSFLMSGMIEYARNDGEVQYHTLGLDIVGSLEATGATGSILASGNQAYLYDGNGNVIANVKGGLIINQSAYEPLGTQTQGIKLSFAFSSKYADESGLSYYGYRFYNPSISRWEKRDPEKEMGGKNLYAFISNSGVNGIDVKGLIPKCTSSMVKENCDGKTCDYRTNQPKPGHVPSSNGCGSAGSTWVPDGNFGVVDFTEACNAHDRCYDTCGNSRTSCDNALGNAMESACLKWWRSWWGYLTLGTAYASCVAQSEIYRVTLLAGGFVAYNNAQRGACLWEKCCQ